MPGTIPAMPPASTATLARVPCDEGSLTSTPRNVPANIAASDGKGLAADLIEQPRVHRWDRTPTAWVQ